MLEDQEDKSVSTRLGDIDDKIKELIVKHWDYAIQYSIEGELRKAFASYKALFHIIEPFDFSSKENLKELTNSLQDFFDALKSKPVTTAHEVQLGKISLTVSELLDLYQTELPKAYKELNLWLRSVMKHPDIDSQFSFETFQSDLSTLENKKKELLKNLDLKQAFEYMSRQAIHDMHARYRWTLAFKEDKNVSKE